MPVLQKVAARGGGQFLEKVPSWGVGFFNTSTFGVRLTIFHERDCDPD